MANIWVLVSGDFQVPHHIGRPHEAFPTDYVVHHQIQDNPPPVYAGVEWRLWSDQQWQDYQNSDAIHRWNEAASWYYNEYIFPPSWADLKAGIERGIRSQQATPTAEQVEAFNGLLAAWGFPEDCRISL